MVNRKRTLILESTRVAWRCCHSERSLWTLPLLLVVIKVSLPPSSSSSATTTTTTITITWMKVILYNIYICGFSFHFISCVVTLEREILEGVESERFDEINELLCDSKLFFILGFWGIGVVLGATFACASEPPGQVHLIVMSLTPISNHWLYHMIWGSIFSSTQPQLNYFYLFVLRLKRFDLWDSYREEKRGRELREKSDERIFLILCF